MDKNKNRLKKIYETEKRKKALRMIEQWIMELEKQGSELEFRDERRERMFMNEGKKRLSTDINSN